MKCIQIMQFDFITYMCIVVSLYTRYMTRDHSTKFLTFTLVLLPTRNKLIFSFPASPTHSTRANDDISDIMDNLQLNSYSHNHQEEVDTYHQDGGKIIYLEFPKNFNIL